MQGKFFVLGKYSLVFFLTIFFIFFHAKFASAATANWTNGAGNGLWNTAGNWNTGVVPDSSTDVVISSPTSILVSASGAAINFNTLQIGGGSGTTNLTLTGNIGTGGSITIANNGMLTQNNTVAQTISGTLLIQSGGILTHSSNGTTAQGQMYIVNFSANSITVNSGGSINVDSRGYAHLAGVDGNGNGPGGGIYGATGAGGANGGSGSSGDNAGGTAYCNISDPALSGFGSGGSARNGWFQGGAGGGLIVLNAAGTITINGNIYARGETSGTSGAGGSVKIIANIVAGTPQNFNISGGTNGGGGGCGLVQYTVSNSIFPTAAYFSMVGGLGAGAGQVLIKKAGGFGDFYAINGSSGSITPITGALTFDNLYVSGSAIIQASPTSTLVVSSTNPLQGDGSGTVQVYGTFSTPNTTTLNNVIVDLKSGGTFLNSSVLNIGTLGTLNLNSGSILNSPITSFNSSGTLFMDASAVIPGISNLTIGAGTVTMNNYTSSTPLSLVNLVLNGGILTHTGNGSTAQGVMHTVNINASGNITINAGGTINVDNKGYAHIFGVDSNGNGPGGGIFVSPDGGGGANGGNGGSSGGAAGGTAYCNVSDPASSGPGSGGAARNGFFSGGAGGGLIILNAAGTATVNGNIYARGEQSGTSGAGGSVKIIANIVTGTPQNFNISGRVGTDGGGGGGCGLVQYTVSNSISPSAAYFSMVGGSGAGAGQVLVKQVGSLGNLFVINSTAGAITPALGALTFDNLYVSGSAIYTVSSTSSLVVSSTNPLQGDGSGTVQVYGTFSTPNTTTLNNVIVDLKSGGTFLNSSVLNIGTLGTLNLNSGSILNSPITSFNSSGTLFMDGNGTNAGISNLTIGAGTMTMNNYTASTPLSLVNFVLNGGTLTHTANGTTAQGVMHTVNINASGNITINAGGTINVDYKGYAHLSGVDGNGNGPGGGIFVSPNGGGGANGGNGGSSGGAAGGTAYCNVSDPASSGPGSGGAARNGWFQGGAGGGLIILNAAGTATVNGNIYARGEQSGTGGAGGSVKIVAGVVAGTPQNFDISGGTGSGGGGCVNVTYLYTNSLTLGQINVNAGTGGNGGVGQVLLNLKLSSLVGWWTFDGTDVTTSTVTDKSGRANHGTRYGGINMVAGKIGQAANFNGSSYYIRTPYNNFPNAGDDRTISFWVRSTNMAVADTALVGWGTNSANSASVIELGPSGVANRKVAFYGNGNNLSSNGTLANNVWNYVTFVLSGTSAKIYINGALDSSGTLTGLNTTAASYFYMGQFSGLNNFKGNLDEVRVYSRALSASEVVALYHLNVDKVNSSATTNGGTLVSSGLMGYWTFDGMDMNATTAKDKSGNGNNGTRNGATKVALGKIGQGLKIDGSSGYVSIPDSSSLVFGTGGTDRPFSVSTWVKPLNNAGYAVAIGKEPYVQLGFGDDPTREWQLISWTDGNIYFACYGNTGVNRITRYGPNSKLTPGKWHNVVATYTGSNTSAGLKIFIDGVRMDTSADDHGNYTGMPNSSNPVTIGLANLQELNANGSMDDVRIYNRVLSTSEIQQLFKKGGGIVNSSQTSAVKNTANNGLVGWWTFDGIDLTATTAKDKSWQGNDGTRNGTTKAVLGKIGQALNFDGSTGYVDLQKSAYDLGIRRSGTFSAWAKMSDFSDYRTIISDFNLDTYAGMNLRVDSGGTQAEFYIYPGNYRISASYNFKANTWYHFVGVMDNSKMYLYVNGVEIGSQDLGGDIAGGSTLKLGRLGGLISGVGYYYQKGSIDDVRIYNRALTAKEVQSLYKTGSGMKIK